MATFRGCSRIFPVNRRIFHVSSRSCSQQQLLSKNLTDNATNELIVDEDDSHYPPIKPKYPPGSWVDFDRKIAWHWHDRKEDISSLKTVQQKLNYLTKHKFTTWMYHPVARVPRLFDYQCDVTKTYPVFEASNVIDKHAILPDIYKDFHLDKTVVDNCKLLVENYIESMDNVSRNKKIAKVSKLAYQLRNKFVPVVENELSHLKTKELLMTLISCLSGYYDHVQRCTIEENVRVAAKWYRDGVQRHMNFDRYSSSTQRPPDFIRQDNAPFFGDHIVNFQIRKEDPLPQFVKVTDPVVDSVAYPVFSYKPVLVGQFREAIRGGFEPGFNIGDPCEFIHVNVVMLNEKHLDHTLRVFGEDIYHEALKGYAISTGFLSTVAQAHYQGFNMYEDISHPVTTQTILTDGRKFMFSTYQLNTLELWKNDNAQPLHNVCWMSYPQNLWNERDVGGGEIVTDETGSLATKNVIDVKTFETLLKFLVLTPAENENGRPNLFEDLKPDVEKVRIPREGEEPVALTRNFQSIQYLENGFKIIKNYKKLNDK